MKLIKVDNIEKGNLYRVSLTKGVDAIIKCTHNGTDISICNAGLVSKNTGGISVAMHDIFCKMDVLKKELQRAVNMVNDIESSINRYYDSPGAMKWPEPAPALPTKEEPERCPFEDDEW